MTFTDDLDKERNRILRLVEQAKASWAAAMRAHVQAPPDAGFATRLQALAEAAATEQIAWEQAHAAGFLWRPVPGAEAAPPPYELRAGTGRRGPPELWQRFDTAVPALNKAIAGSDAGQVAREFGEVASAAADLAAAVAGEDALLQAVQERSRARTAVA
jgi:hypothetical protein